MRTVAVLFARADSIYKTMPGCDVWDMERDARKFPGGMPIVGHPPCRTWGGLRHMAKPRPDEKALSTWCVDQIRENGGVLEHPATSKLWRAKGLPEPGGLGLENDFDEWGGWTLEAPQYWWGHLAWKMTRFYIVGIKPTDRNFPLVPFRGGVPTHVITTSKRKGEPGCRLRCNAREREHTPPALAEWLVELARRTRTPSTSASTKGELVKALKWALNMLELSNESARGFKFGWTKFFAIKAFLATPAPSASTEGACEHEWKDKVDSISGRDCYCIKCQMAGDRQEDGTVYWPAT